MSPAQPQKTSNECQEQEDVLVLPKELAKISPDLAKMLKQYNMSLDKNGVRMKVLNAYTEESMDVIRTMMQDMQAQMTYLNQKWSETLALQFYELKNQQIKRNRMTMLLELVSQELIDYKPTSIQETPHRPFPKNGLASDKMARQAIRAGKSTAKNSLGLFLFRENLEELP